MNPFLLIERLGDNLEASYKTIYTGGGCLYGICVYQIIQYFVKLADVGMLRNATRIKIEDFMTRDMELENTKIISRNSNEVVLVNSELHESDKFELTDYIGWITNELCNDSIMKKLLCGRNDYDGVKNIMNSFADLNYFPVMKKNWVDFCIIEDRVFFSKGEGVNIFLYTRSLDKEEAAVLGEGLEGRLLCDEKLEDGTLYSLPDGSILVNLEYGYFLKINGNDTKDFVCEKINGIILDQLEDGRILFLDKDNIVCLSLNGAQKIISPVDYFGITYTDGKEIYKKIYYKISAVVECIRTGFENCCNTKRICREILWKALLLTLYNFDNVIYQNSVGNRLKCFCFFDQLPMTFTIKEIKKKLCEIEKCGYDGLIAQGESYSETMYHLIMLESKNLDENNTVTALEKLLDSVKQNPYKKVLDYPGIRLVNCFDLIFDDFKITDYGDFTIEND